MHCAVLGMICGFGEKKIILLTEDNRVFAEAQSSLFFSSETLSDARSLHRSYLPTSPLEGIC